MASPILPNSPLAEVVCELRFPGDLSLLGKWGEIQADLRGDYPSLFVPAAVPGTAPMLQPTQLATPDRKGKVMLAINSFAVSTHSYSGFDDFLAAFRAALDVFRRHTNVEAFTRLGLRYTNILPRDFGDGPMPPGALHPCLNLRLSSQLQPAAAEAPQLVYLAHRTPLDLRLSLVTAPEFNAATKLDLDCYQNDELPVERLDGFLSESHDFIEQTFLSLLTDEYHRYLKGED